MVSADLSTVLTTWRDRIAALRAMQLVREATLLEQVIADVEAAARQADADITLTPAQAATLSGYSTDHVRRMLATGRWPNVGSRHHPRIRRSDLPRKRPSCTAA